MIFALLTLLAALSLAATAGWFSIVGFMAIYAGAPMYALIMGVVTECAKLVTTSWLYRNWQYAGWRIKAPLIYFTLALMTATSIGVFGFLSKAHLEQGAGTIDNSAKIEQLQYQIEREKAIIADNEKVTKQLDDTVNSLLGKDRADRALSVRKAQSSQRAQLRADSAEAQKRIDTLITEKFGLESEVRKMQLDVGPIRYIAELFYGVDENATKNIEAAVRIFTLLLVSTLDPLAVILLIAANHTLIRLRNEEKETSISTESILPKWFENSNKENNKISSTDKDRISPQPGKVDDLSVRSPTGNGYEDAELADTILQESVEILDEEEIVNQGSQDIPQLQTVDVSKRSISAVTTRENVQKPEIFEDLGIADETNLQDSADRWRTELQTQILNTGTLLDEEQESLPPGPENDGEASQETLPDLWRISDIPEITDTPPTIAGETVDQPEGSAENTENIQSSPPVQIEDKEKIEILENFKMPVITNVELPIVRSPILSRITDVHDSAPTPLPQPLSETRVSWAQEDNVLRELLGNVPHFSPQRLDETLLHEAPLTRAGSISNSSSSFREGQLSSKELGNNEDFHKIIDNAAPADKYPKALSWLTEFRRLK